MKKVLGFVGVTIFIFTLGLSIMEASVREKWCTDRCMFETGHVDLEELIACIDRCMEKN